MRKFEKISTKQFIKDTEKFAQNLTTIGILSILDDLQIPNRATQDSAGNDIYSPFSFTLMPQCTIKIPLGIKAYMNEDEFLMIVPRSSIGFKYGIKLSNTVGIIDSGYVDNPDNEGHIQAALFNTGDVPWNVQVGDRILQGIFMKYLITDDDTANETRTSGIGSTGT